jgi:hypothetical protein
MEGARVGAVQEKDESEGAEEDDGEEAAAMLVVEAVAGFEIGILMDVERARVKEAVGGVDHPDGYEHGGGFGPGECEGGAVGDEEGPECGYGGRVE